VPSETRQAFRDGRTGFERILPGPERMYPDTDTPPFPIPDAWLAEIEAHMPERPWERESRYARLGLDVRAAKRLAAAPWSSLFDALAPQSELGARRLAAGLEKRLVHHRRKSGVRALPDAARLAPLVRAVDEARLRPEAFEAVLDRLLLPGGEPERIVASRAPRSDDDTRLCEAVEEALDLAPRYEPARLVRWAMGRVAPEFLGRVAPSAVRERIEAALGERAESPR
jgi:Glu-tRNA(Gln) amidotransferase subunit E-like FAD-binding protein